MQYLLTEDELSNMVPLDKIPGQVEIEISLRQLVREVLEIAGDSLKGQPEEIKKLKDALAKFNDDVLKTAARHRAKIMEKKSG